MSDFFPSKSIPKVYAYTDTRFEGYLKVGYTTKTAEERVREQYPVILPNQSYEILLEENFYRLLKILIYSEVFWKKRHEWKITYEETKKTRTILIWDLKEQNCVIYKLIKMWQVDI